MDTNDESCGLQVLEYHRCACGATNGPTRVEVLHENGAVSLRPGIDVWGERGAVVVREDTCFYRQLR